MLYIVVARTLNFKSFMETLLLVIKLQINDYS